MQEKNKIIHKLIVGETATIKEAMHVLNDGGKEIVLVAEKNKLSGILTDGDFRRSILNGISINESISSIMNKDYFSVKTNISKKDALKILLSRGLKHLPVIDNNKIVDLFFINELIDRPKRNNLVVIMAGGKGKRLRPLSNNIPKPMIDVGGVPLLETIIGRLISNGFNNINISINYLGHKIKDYFADGSNFGCKISYLEEQKPLGTGGSLSLIKEKTDLPILVLNGDLVTDVNFNDMVEYHEKNNFSATLGIREYNYQVPFGVVNLENQLVKSFAEKPDQSYFINTGIYVLNPNVIKHIPKETYFDMPNIIEKLNVNNEMVGAFPITESWIDIGRLEDYNKVKNNL